MNRKQTLARRIKWLTWIFIVGLVASGVTAIPLRIELEWAAKFFPDPASSGLSHWILKVRNGVQEADARFPFLAYGTDWLAFGHFVIAIAFIGGLRDPVRNIWLYTFGMIACAMVVPYALIFGGLRGIPIYWRLIDCSFGIFGIIPIWLCRRWAKEIEMMPRQDDGK